MFCFNQPFFIQIDLYGEIFDWSAYLPKTQYEFDELSAVRNVKVYECCPEPYIHITYSFDLKLQTPGPDGYEDDVEADTD